MIRKCTACRSSKFKACITLRLVGVPLEILADGTMEYDDTKADYSEGWDTLEQPEVQCASCFALYDLSHCDEADDRQTYELIPMAAAAGVDAGPGRDEQEG